MVLTFLGKYLESVERFGALHSIAPVLVGDVSSDKCLVVIRGGCAFGNICQQIDDDFFDWCMM